MPGGLMMQNFAFIDPSTVNWYQKSDDGGRDEVCVGEGCLSAAFVRSSGQILLLLSRYLMHALNDFDKIDMEYSLAPTDELIRFCGSRSRS